MADFMRKLNDRVPDKDENKTKFMYSCARKVDNQASKLQDAVGLLIFAAICCYVIYRFVTVKRKYKILEFTQNQEVSKLLIGLLLLTNIKNLSNSLVNNIILPIVEPILPFLLCKLRIHYGQIKIELGELISDLLVFTINLLIIYFIYMLIM